MALHIRAPNIHPFGKTIAIPLWFGGRRRMEALDGANFSVNHFHERVSPKSTRTVPRFYPKGFIRHEISGANHLIPFQTPKSFQRTS
jgi:hypothetical protein